MIQKILKLHCFENIIQICLYIVFYDFILLFRFNVYFSLISLLQNCVALFLLQNLVFTGFLIVKSRSAVLKDLNGKTYVALLYSV